MVSSSEWYQVIRAVGPCLSSSTPQGFRFAVQARPPQRRPVAYVQGQPSPLRFGPVPELPAGAVPRLDAMTGRAAPTPAPPDWCASLSGTVPPLKGCPSCFCPPFCPCSDWFRPDPQRGHRRPSAPTRRRCGGGLRCGVCTDGRPRAEDGPKRTRPQAVQGVRLGACVVCYQSGGGLEGGKGAAHPPLCRAIGQTPPDDLQRLRCA